MNRSGSGKDLQGWSLTITLCGVLICHREDSGRLIGLYEVRFITSLFILFEPHNLGVKLALVLISFVCIRTGGH
jgi:hypothetical protein